jgi:hypothetical protein
MVRNYLLYCSLRRLEPFGISIRVKAYPAPPGPHRAEKKKTISAAGRPPHLPVIDAARSTLRDSVISTGLSVDYHMIPPDRVPRPWRLHKRSTLGMCAWTTPITCSQQLSPLPVLLALSEYRSTSVKGCCSGRGGYTPFVAVCVPENIEN